MSTDPMWDIRHAWATSTPGDYVQNAADFDRRMAEHDSKVLEDAAAAVEAERMVGNELYVMVDPLSKPFPTCRTVSVPKFLRERAKKARTQGFSHAV